MSFLNYKFKPPHQWGIDSEVHVDLGAGSFPRNPFNASELIAFDVLDPKDISINTKSNTSNLKYMQVSRFKAFPLGDNSVTSVSGFDFLEHLSREPQPYANEFISIMNEAFRILKPGGIALFVTPAFPLKTAFQDPTHINILTENTYEYFCGNNPLALKLGYGFEGKFELVSQFWAGPFGKVWKYADSGNDRGTLRNRFNLSIIRLSEIARFKFRKSHLVWILRKN
jgi:SAM-dependent methyltransferase